MDVDETAPQSKSATCLMVGSAQKHLCRIFATMTHTQGHLTFYPDERHHLCLMHFTMGVLGVHVMVAHNLLWIQNDSDFVAVEFASIAEASEWASFITYPIFATPPITTPFVSESPMKPSNPPATSFPSPVFLRNTLKLHRHASKPRVAASPSVELVGRTRDECHRIQVEKLVAAEKSKIQQWRTERQELAALTCAKWEELQKEQQHENATAIAQYKASKAAEPDILHHQLLSRLQAMSLPSAYHYRVGMAIAALIIQRLYRGYRTRLSIYSLQRLERLQKQMAVLQEKTDILQQEYVVRQAELTHRFKDEPATHNIIMLPQQASPLKHKTSKSSKFSVPQQASPLKHNASKSAVRSKLQSEITSRHGPAVPQHFIPETAEVVPASSPATSLLPVESSDSPHLPVITHVENEETKSPLVNPKRYSISIEPEPVLEDNQFYIDTITMSESDSLEETTPVPYAPYIRSTSHIIDTDEGSPVSILMEYLQRKGKAVPKLPPKRSVESPNRLHRRLSLQTASSVADMEENQDA